MATHWSCVRCANILGFNPALQDACHAGKQPHASFVPVRGSKNATREASGALGARVCRVPRNEPSFRGTDRPPVR
eukprot:3202876-Prymnesium_polylepis.2